MFSRRRRGSALPGLACSALVLALTINAHAHDAAQLTRVSFEAPRGLDSDDLPTAGEAILQLVERGGPEADEALEAVHQDTSRDILVRTWAAAGRVQLAEDLDELKALAPLMARFPGLDRPVKLRLASVDLDAETALALVAYGPMKDTVGQLLLEMGPRPLVHEMIYGPEKQRRLAAGYVANLGQTDSDAVTRELVRALRFDGAGYEPWSGGSLYIPQLSYSRSGARQVIHELAAWRRHLAHDASVTRQIDANLRSVGLLRAAGYSWDQALRSGAS